MSGYYGRKEHRYGIKERGLPTTSTQQDQDHVDIYTFNFSPSAFYSASSSWTASLSARVKTLLSTFSWCTIGYTWNQSPNWGVRLWEVKEYREQISRALWQKISLRMSPGKLEKQVFTGVSVCLLDRLASSLNKSIYREHELIHNPPHSSNEQIAPWPLSEFIDRQAGDKLSEYCDALHFLDNISTLSS